MSKDPNNVKILQRLYSITFTKLLRKTCIARKSFKTVMADKSMHEKTSLIDEVSMRIAHA